MESYPYWAYAAIPGTLTEDKEQEALDEGRRAFALELVTRETYYPTTGEAIDRAVAFEAYLRGVAPVTPVETTEYENLIKRSNHLLALEAAGVDNWEGYVGG